MKAPSVMILAALTLGAVSATAGDITGKIVLKGAPPKERDITPLKEDANCGKLHRSMPTTKFYVVGGSGELADVVVSVEGAPAKSGGASAAPMVLDQKGCIYTPQIFAVQTDQKILVKNSDQVLHNVHSQPAESSGNKEINTAQMAGAPDLTFTFSKPELFLKFKCDVHPWMFAWASVFDHPYFAISDKDGTFKISNVPPGKYKLQAAHRKAGNQTQEIEVKDGEATKVEFTFEPK